MTEPALSYALLHGPAVSADLAAANVVMTALVMENEEPHRARLPVEQVRVEHEHTGGRQTKIRERGVEHVTHRAATKCAAGNPQQSIALEVHQR
jgi:hypothetical protein